MFWGGWANQEKGSEIKTKKKRKDSGERYWNVILQMKEIVIRVRKKECDAYNVCPMFFTGNVVFFFFFFDNSLADFLKY